MDIGELVEDEVYRIGVIETRETDRQNRHSDSDTANEHREPPVDEGDILDVEIEDVGDKGDGIARVGPGYIVFVPETEVGERVEVELTEVRENMAFADVVNRYDRSD